MLNIPTDAKLIELAVHNDHSNFGDDPSTIRWRCWWERDYSGNVLGIRAQAYPVVKETPKGAWINPHGYYAHGAWSQPYKELLRWVSNEGGAAWAKRTQAEAMDSLAIRYQRWANRIIGDVGYFIEASRALEKLMPEKEFAGIGGRKGLREYVAANA